MTQEEFGVMLDQAKATGLRGKAYPKQCLINITDADGIIQSYYASTGTAIFRDGNDKYKSKKKTMRGFPYDRFLALCMSEGDDDILDFFKED